jgi:hypothetical protein
MSEHQQIAHGSRVSSSMCVCECRLFQPLLAFFHSFFHPRLPTARFASEIALFSLFPPWGFISFPFPGNDSFVARVVVVQSLALGQFGLLHHPVVSGFLCDHGKEEEIVFHSASEKQLSLYAFHALFLLLQLCYRQRRKIERKNFAFAILNVAQCYLFRTPPSERPLPACFCLSRGKY